MAFDATLPVFTARPDWGESVRERLEFRTDGIMAEDGTEQTRRSRRTPRRTFEFAIGTTENERQRLQAQVWGRGVGKWNLPLWPDGQYLAASLSSGAAAIPADTTTRDFEVGGTVVLLGEAAGEVAVHEIDGITSSELSLVGVTAQAWPAGTLVLPSRQARLDPTFATEAFASDASFGRVRLVVAEANPWPAATLSPTYRGFPVLTTRPVTVRDPESALVRLADAFDDSIAVASWNDPVGIPLYRQAHHFGLDGRAAIADFRGFVYALNGKRNSLWVPTWQDDLTVAGAMGSGSTSLPVAWVGYTDLLLGVVNRQDVRIELVDGSVYYRRITAAVETSASVETLTLSSALGVAIDASTVRQVSFLGLCRSDSDIFELEYWTSEYADVAAAWRGRQHDV